MDDIDLEAYPNLSGKTCFVGIGAQRAGTSWLSKYLANHPEVCFSPIKELHYFDWRFLADHCGGWHAEFQRRLGIMEARMEARSGSGNQSIVSWRIELLRKRIQMADRPEAYLEYFNQLAGAQHKAYGEISPSYSMLPSMGFASMKRLLPGPKLIWILRNPADRFWSQLRFEMRLKKNFSALDEYTNRLDDPQYILRTDYAKTLENILSEFTPDQFLVVFYENLFQGDKTQREVEKITDFLGISSSPAQFGEKVNASLDVPLVADLRTQAVRRFGHVYQAMQEHFGPLPENWQEDLKLVESIS